MVRLGCHNNAIDHPCRLSVQKCQCICASYVKIEARHEVMCKRSNLGDKV